MKKLSTTLLMVFTTITLLSAQEKVGSYYNDYFHKNYYVEALQRNNTLSLYFQVEGTSDSDNVCIYVKEEGKIAEFIAALQQAKAKYSEWVEVAINNNVTKMTKEMTIDIPRVTVCWYGSQWWFDYNHKLTLIFMITDSGKHLLVITGEATASSNEYIDQKYYLAFSSPEDFDNLINAIQPTELINKLNSKQQVDDLFQ